MSKETRLSGTEHLILGILIGAGELYGLEMVRRSNGLLARGTVYVTLDRMEDKGLVTSRAEDKEPGVSGIPKRLYRITGEGSRAFKALERKHAVIFGRLAEA